MVVEPNGILKRVLKRVKPDKKDSEEEALIIKRIIGLLEKKKIRSVLVGSIAKGTDLKDTKDIDIFVLFKKDVERKTLEEEGLRIGKEVFDSLGITHNIDYAEHPYVTGVYRDKWVEIVPCYDTKTPISAVDRTPHHTKYVIEKLKKRAINDDIRIAKQFMLGIGVYGAEAKVCGFSGYCVELLVLHYGSFTGLIEAAAGWEFGDFIDIDSLWENQNDAKSFFGKVPLIIIDPVDKYRNVASAVSEEKMARFIYASKRFLKKPSENYFFPGARTAPKIDELKKMIKKRGSKLAALVFKHGEVNINNLHSQLRKTESVIREDVERCDFKVLKTGYWTNEKDLSLILCELYCPLLPNVEIMIGPPVHMDDKFYEDFTKRYKKTYISGRHMVAEIKRRIITAKNAVELITKRKHGFGKTFKDIDAEVLYDSDILNVRDASYKIFLEDFLSFNEHFRR